ncbi:MAG TPA: UDP-N-acetylmuramate dehydrogenase [Gammaproteobacteria bacterium]|nr:UDP-N-acetylmuramate dehydrogenase [Gammaproteobacteria bacterium]
MPSSLFVQQNASLKPFNTFGIEANARYFANIHHTEELLTVLSQNIFHDMPKLILGEGSNVLFTQNYPGLVIKNSIKGVQKIAEDRKHVWLKVGAGENWHDFVMFCISEGYSGIENLSLIPGTIGAAPIQNIGAYGVELCDVFSELEAWDLLNNEIRIFKREDCQFAYRESIFKHLYKNRFSILSVSFCLHKQPEFHIEYGDIRKTLEIMQVKDLSVKAISDAVIHIRRSKLPDPKELGNAGSFFKNPFVSPDHFTQLQKTFPNIPSFPAENTDLIKIPAGWLIEQCGWKGKRFGDVGVYEKQALILVNYHAGKGSAILELAQNIQKSVQEKFSVELVPEVRVC